MMTFCTLFDSYYLDKGIALYNSLARVSNDFCLYIFCFDDKTVDVLRDLELEHAVIIHHSEFESQQLLKIKTERTKAEYCWTCTTSIIEYVLDNYGVDHCVYIDSDLCFFSDPKVLFNEIKENDAHIVMVSHRFSNSLKNRIASHRYGEYCVQFNYFDQTEESRRALAWWRNQCLNWCYCKVEKERYGDQKYLNMFPKMFKGVYLLQHRGGGVAPWNINQYCLIDESEDGIRLLEKKTGKKFNLVFYHFHSMRFENDKTVNTCALTNDSKIINAIYSPYLLDIFAIREMLKERYGVVFSNIVFHSNNLLKRYYQTTVRPLLFKNRNNMIDLSQIIEV